MSASSFPVVIGDYVTLQGSPAARNGGGYLYTRGRVKDNATLSYVKETSFVLASSGVSRPARAGDWRIVSAGQAAFGDLLRYGDQVHLLNDDPTSGYLDTCHYVSDLSDLKRYRKTNQAWLGVFTAPTPRRDTGTGTWRVVSATGKATGEMVSTSDSIRLVNGYPDNGGCLMAVGAVKEVSFLAGGPGQDDAVVLVSDSATGPADSTTWRIDRSPTRTPFSFDPAKMIPLRSAKYRAYDFTVTLTGGALKGAEPYELCFDTGSFSTSLPGAVVDRTKVKVLKSNVDDPWGKLSDKVQGDLSVKSQDGTVYTAKAYVFYLRKQDANTDAPDDRTARWGNSIMGGFPSAEPGSGLVPFPCALAADGFGIFSTFTDKPSAIPTGHPVAVSNCFSRTLETDWSEMRAYLKLGPLSTAEADYLRWRTDIPHKQSQTYTKFCPEMVPGFRLTIDLPAAKTRITSVDLQATVDSGAPTLVTRLSSTDPQNDAKLKAYFLKDGVWKNWGTTGPYYNHAKSLVSDARTTVAFADSNGVLSAYAFSPGTVFTDVKVPSSVVVTDWTGDVPWAEAPSTPRDRFNLGNTVHFFCPVYYWDIKAKKVGICFR